jgi:hypothetical protein
MNQRGQPALNLYVQTFGDLVTFKSHIHAPLADGVFLPSGTFRILPPLPDVGLCEVLRIKCSIFSAMKACLMPGSQQAWVLP